MPTWYVKDRNGPHVIVSADHRFPGRYLKAYDPEAHDGRGQTEWTTDLADAVVYPDFVAAFEAWRQVPTSRPKREDGKPNRPLTGVPVMFDPVKVCSRGDHAFTGPPVTDEGDPLNRAWCSEEHRAADGEAFDAQHYQPR